MTSAFSWQNSVNLLSVSFLYYKATFACYSRYLLTSYFCIPVTYNEKDIFLRCQFQKVLQFFIEPFNITVNQVCAPTTNAKEAEVEWLCEELQDLLELTSPKDVLFIIGNRNAKEGSQEIPGVTGKFGLVVQNEAGQRLTEFC